MQAQKLPLGDLALHAAVLAHCAGDDRYFTSLDVLFEAFDDWTNARDYSDALAQLSELGGVSRERFEACLANKALEEKIFQPIADAQAEYGVNSTPTVIVNSNIMRVRCALRPSLSISTTLS